MVPSANVDLFDRGGALKGFDSDTHVELYSVVGVQVPEHGADLGAEHAFEGNLSRFDQGDLLAELAGGGRNL